MSSKTKTIAILGLLVFTGCSQPEGSSVDTRDDVTDMSMNDLGAGEVDLSKRDMPTADLTGRDVEDAGPECVDDTACGFDQMCDAGRCVCDPDRCTPGWGCVEGGSHCRQLGTNMGCTPGSCPEGQACSTDLERCIDVEPPPSCEDGSPCQGDDDCMGVGVCEEGCCVECMDDSMCADNQVCMNSTCVDASTPSCQVCEPNNPGACDAGTPLCFQGCCVECLIDVDCADDEICSDDHTCVPKPSCVDEPDLCSMTERCDTASGQCRPVSEDCQGSVNGECPDGQMCNPLSNQCETDVTGCGRCNPDCTCDNGLTCDGFNCTGCSEGFDQRCPVSENSLNLCLSGVCL